MRHPTSIDDRLVDRLLAGDDNVQDPQLAAFVRDVRAVYTTPPDVATEARHVAAMVETAHLLTDKGDPVARPASKAHGPDSQASGLPTRRRIVQGQFQRLSVRFAVGLVALVGATSALAVTGALPDPLQRALADAASTVGVSLDSASGSSISSSAGDTDGSSDESVSGYDADRSYDSSASGPAGDEDSSADSSTDGCDSDFSTDSSKSGPAGDEDSSHDESTTCEEDDEDAADAEDADEVGADDDTDAAQAETNVTPPSRTVTTNPTKVAVATGARAGHKSGTKPKPAPAVRPPAPSDEDEDDGADEPSDGGDE